MTRFSHPLLVFFFISPPCPPPTSCTALPFFFFLSLSLSLSLSLPPPEKKNLTSPLFTSPSLQCLLRPPPLPLSRSPAEPDWASLTLGVFVCQACSLLHRSIPHISRVKSVQDTWDASDVEVRPVMANIRRKKTSWIKQRPPPPTPRLSEDSWHLICACCHLILYPWQNANISASVSDSHK